MSPETVMNRLSMLSYPNTIVLRFARHGMEGLLMLEHNERQCRLQIHERDKILLMAVLYSQSWDHPDNQNIRVVLPADFDPRHIAQSGIAQHLQSISLAEPNEKTQFIPDQIAKNPRGHQRQRALIEQFVQNCGKEGGLPELLDEWEMTYHGEHRPNDGLPQIALCIKVDDETVAELVVDKWSGNIFVGDRMIDAYRRPKQVAQLLHEAAMAYIES